MSKREMLINYVPGEECRIAIIEDGRLDELYQERASNESHVGNIYKGKVVNVEPSIQAAFIDFGLERNGFLHISDLHPMYFPGDAKEETEQVGLKTPRRDRPPIQRCLRRGQEVLVQVLKEGIGTKGPTLTSYLSIPGRYLVMMPHMEKLGVSRKVDDDEARRESREILNALNPPPGFGFIIRTAGIGRSKTDLKRDLAYLQRLWKTIDRKMTTTRIGELFAESDLVIRTIRDVYTPDITRIVVDDSTAARRALDFLTISNPRSGSNVYVYNESVPLFHRYEIEKQIETIHARTVPLPSGGSLVIDSTEALVAIDVNSGKYRDNRDAEMTAYKVNLEAVDEICRQLRLRDLGGVIVNDLIDMRNLKHRREIENRFKDNLKKDRARTRTLPISQFGILEMTRQRMRPSLKKSIYMDCPACHGAALVKSPESVVLDVMRRLAAVLQRDVVIRVELTVSPDVAFQLLNRKRSQLVAIEQTHGKSVLVRVNGAGSLDYVSLAAFDARGGEVEAESLGAMKEPSLELITSSTPMDDVFEEIEVSAETEEESANESADEISSEDETATELGDGLVSTDDLPPQTDVPVNEEGQPGGRRRRRRRGGRGRRRHNGNTNTTQNETASRNDESVPAGAPINNGDSLFDGEAAVSANPDSTSDDVVNAQSIASNAPSYDDADADMDDIERPGLMPSADDSVHHGLEDDSDHEPGDINGNLVAPQPVGGAPQGHAGNNGQQGQGGGRRRRRRRGGRGRNKNRQSLDSQPRPAGQHSSTSAGSNGSQQQRQQQRQPQNQQRGHRPQQHPPRTQPVERGSTPEPIVIPPQRMPDVRVVAQIPTQPATEAVPMPVTRTAPRPAAISTGYRGYRSNRPRPNPDATSSAPSGDNGTPNP
ncbi:MAG: Rne/Rng family ribonuclease [Phycisphaeraceae bacterium]|nr:Rne/Rng family ribonuclease [Phycisphaeraceae bacterium]